MARSNKVLVPDAKQNLDSFKMEVANSLNVNLKQGYNGDISAKDAGSIGGKAHDYLCRKQHERQRQQHDEII